MPSRSTIDASRGSLIRQGAYADAAKLGLLAAGLGAALRGGAGLFQLGRKNMYPAARPAVSAPVTVDIPVRPRKQDEEEDKLKLAAATDKEAGWFSDVLSGGANTDSNHWWGSPPLSFAAGAAGLYGGWKLSDMLMDSRRKSQLQSELDAAKKEYEEALRGESKLGQALDHLFDELEKNANTADIAGSAMGLAALLGLIGGGGAGYLTYNMAKSRDPGALKEKAKKQYRAEQYRKRPSPIFARPVPQSASTNVLPPSEETGIEDETSPLDKAATYGLLLSNTVSVPKPPPPIRMPRNPAKPPPAPAQPRPR